MGFSKYHQVLFVYTITLVSGFGEILATRPMEGEKWVMMKQSLLLQALPKGPVAPPGLNPCTHIPGRGSGRCTLGQMKVAGGHAHVLLARGPPAFPDHILSFAAAISVAKGTHQKPHLPTASS